MSHRAAVGDRGHEPAIPLWLKVAYTLWIAAWLPIYWSRYGAGTFLWLCDFANVVTLLAIWLESPLLLSSQLVGVTVPHLGWTIDWLGRIAFGFHPIGGTEYMFDPAKPWWLRALSLFHLWMLPLLVWVVRRTGYDRRGIWVQTALMSVLLLPLSVFVGARAENFNWVWGPFSREQAWMPPAAWLACLYLLYPLVLFLPAHWVWRRLLPPAHRGPASHAAPRDGVERRVAAPGTALRLADQPPGSAGAPSLTRPTARS